uniref:GRIP and coiled-coil domain containing 1 n=1 Tax=Podarcis muralis TaxID=64176 RepID=A0A670J8K7_PODMU
MPGGPDTSPSSPSGIPRGHPNDPPPALNAQPRPGTPEAADPGASLDKRDRVYSIGVSPSAQAQHRLPGMRGRAASAEVGAGGAGAVRGGASCWARGFGPGRELSEPAQPPGAMEKFGMNFGGGPSKKDLQETIEVQKKQLLQYQGRLKDVVRAYKSLLKEKEALEASLKVLSVSHEVDAGLGSGVAQPPGVAGSSSPDLSEDQSSVHSEDSHGTAASLASVRGDLVGMEEGTVAVETAVSPSKLEETSSSESSGVSSGSGELIVGGAGESDRRVLQLKTQLSTLTSALATVTQEKSRMEASYQADKKKAKHEMESASRRAEEERSRLEAEVKEAQEQLAEVKARLIAQQHDRAQEQGDHAVMLRELQRLLQSERALRQEAELGLEEAREALAGKAGVADRAEGAEHQARQLGREVEELRRELRALREESARPDPQVQELQAEAASLRSHFQAQLLQEMRKTAQAEDRIQLEEQRVASLEAQISEVSELLGSYEKAKQKEQLATQKLKERIAQLDLENKTLAMAASGRSPLDLAAFEESSLDVNVLKDRMEKLKEMLQEATKDSPASAQEIEAFCRLEPPKGGTETGDGEKATAAYYQQELKQLKEEFERYKQRAQVVLKNKSAKDGSLAKELEAAQEQLAELKEKHVSLRLSCEEGARQRRQEAEAWRQEAARLQQQHRQELERSQLGFQEKVLRLEEEMHKQRDRALAVLAEKDQELEQLRALVLPYYGLQGPKQGPAQAGGPQSGDPKGDEGDVSLETLTQALHLAAPKEPAFLLYTEQLARKEVEASALKKQKGRLQKSARDQGREGANLEYLKNIFYRFLTLTDLLGRQQTLRAILTILHFSPEEKQAVLSQAGGAGSWWPSGKRSWPWRGSTWLPWLSDVLRRFSADDRRLCLRSEASSGGLEGGPFLCPAAGGERQVQRETPNKSAPSLGLAAPVPGLRGPAGDSRLVPERCGALGLPPVGVTGWQRLARVPRPLLLQLPGPHPPLA